jgi:ATP-dependent DNA ligase
MCAIASGTTGLNDANAYAYAFDLLALHEADTCKLPLHERKAMLASLLNRERRRGAGRIPPCGATWK